ncbi:MAG: response regulator [Lachnospiraceae bacterium]|nr:response regulator [Lachnospiraceae bacterium]
MKKRIMIVDDSRMLLMQLQHILSETEYEVAAYCQDGETAITKYEEILPDLVTMDIIMPGIDGLEAAKAILEVHPDAKIVMLSSLVYDDTIEEAKAIGAKAFIYKPFEKEQVLETIKRVLEEE